MDDFAAEAFLTDKKWLKKMEEAVEVPKYPI